MPDIPPGNLRALLEQLHYLYKRAGMPGVRRIAKGTRFSHTAVYGLLTQARTEPPNQAILFDVVLALLLMRPRSIGEKEREETLDWFDATWMAALEHPFDEIAAQEAPAATQETWAHTVRDALRDEGASELAPNERWRVLAGSDGEGDAPEPLPDLITALHAAAAAARSKKDESSSPTPTQNDALSVVLERYGTGKALGAGALPVPREDAIARSRQLFPFLDVAQTRTPRYRRVEFRVPLTDEADYLLISLVADLAQVLVITQQPDYVEDEEGYFETGQRLLKLYVIVRDWSDLDFYRAVEELAELHSVRLAGLKHVASPTELESTILTLLTKMDDEVVVATHAGISVRQVRAIRAEAPKKLKARTFEQALIDAERFGIIPSNGASPRS